MFRLEPPKHGVIDAGQEVGGHKFLLRARQVRQDKNGRVTALVALMVDGNAAPVHSDWITVDDADSRHSFTNAVYGTGRSTNPGWIDASLKASLDPRKFEYEMMLWSRALYPAYIGASSGGYEYGDKEPSAPHWAIPGLVLSGLTGIWFGARESNKSTMMRLAAQSLNNGLYSFMFVKDKEECIWVNAEESSDEHTRQLGNVNAALGLPRDSRLYTLHARGMGIEDLALRLERAVRETSAQHIFIDSLSRLSRGMNLNENATANLLMDSVGGLGPSVNWIGHTGQENEHRLAGSRHFENAARLMVKVESRISMGGVSPDLTRGVRTTVTKGNGVGQVAPMFYTLGYHRDFGLLKAEKADSERWPVLNCDALVGEAKKSTCGRKTWTGVQRSGRVLCSRHIGEEPDD